MYESFFGLTERPFDLAPNPRFLGLTRKQREAMGNLRYGLTTPRGLTLLLGEAGTGKTTLIHTILGEMEPDRVECVLVSNPTLSRNEFYEYLADGFGLRTEAYQSKTQFLFALRRHLEERHLAGKLSAIVLDEAQSLPDELLEEVRLLSNIETASQKLLNVVLVGQPELSLRLNEPGLRQLKQRVSLRCTIAPLSLPETAAYIAGRLRIAGAEPAAIFTREAVSMIHRLSKGVPRTINVVCDNALIGGFAANTRPVPMSILTEVMKDFDLDTEPAAAVDLDAEEATSSPAPAVEEEPSPEPHITAPRPGVDQADAAVASRPRRFSFFSRS